MARPAPGALPAAGPPQPVEPGGAGGARGHVPSSDPEPELSAGRSSPFFCSGAHRPYAIGELALRGAGTAQGQRAWALLAGVPRL